VFHKFESTESMVNVLSMVLKLTENIVQDEEGEVDKEEKLVAARNEENVKVSAAALKEDTSSATPVIENISTTKPTTLTLRHTYKEGKSENGFARPRPATSHCEWKVNMSAL